MLLPRQRRPTRPGMVAGMGSKRIWTGVFTLLAALAFVPAALAQAPAAPPARLKSLVTVFDTSGTIPIAEITSVPGIACF